MSPGSPHTCAPSSTRARDCWSRSSRRHQPDHTRRYSAVSAVIMRLASTAPLPVVRTGLRSLCRWQPSRASRRGPHRSAAPAPDRRRGQPARSGVSDRPGRGWVARPPKTGGRSRPIPLLQPGCGLRGRRRTPPPEGAQLAESPGHCTGTNQRTASACVPGPHH
jgi:hypothetical protein